MMKVKVKVKGKVKANEKVNLVIITILDPNKLE